MAGLLPTPMQTVARPTAVSPTQRVGSFQNQQLGALTAGLNPAAGAGVSSVTSPRLQALSERVAPVSVVQKQSRDTMTRLKDSSARTTALAIAAKQNQTKLATPGASVKSGGQYTGRSSAPTGGRASGTTIAIKDTVKVGNGYLRKDAGTAFINMANAYKQATGKTLGLTEGWRSYDRQVELYAAYKAGRGNLAAKPGTSEHGSGTAVDMNGMGSVGSASFNWLRQNGPKFGYQWTGGTFPQVESWHWSFRG